MAAALKADKDVEVCGKHKLESEELAREIEAWLEAMEAGSPRTNRVPA